MEGNYIKECKRWLVTIRLFQCLVGPLSDPLCKIAENGCISTLLPPFHTWTVFSSQVKHCEPVFTVLRFCADYGVDLGLSIQHARTVQPMWGSHLASIPCIARLVREGDMNESFVPPHSLMALTNKDTAPLLFEILTLLSWSQTSHSP